MADPTLSAPVLPPPSSFSPSLASALPTDPSLAIDPAILGESSHSQQPPPAQQSPPDQPAFIPANVCMDYVPQGDPFAPQAPDTYLPPQIPQMPSPPRNLKRKRKQRPAARPDEECSFCQGDKRHNRAGYPERLISCVNCGRSGHPSCLDIESIANVLHTYPWYCIECKICEVCQKKSNGDRMLFCDACDRGWHMDCLDPPLDSTPNGSWTCPLCPPIPPLPPEITNTVPIQDMSEPAFPTSPFPATSPPMQVNGTRSRTRSRSKNRQRNNRNTEAGGKSRNALSNGVQQTKNGRTSSVETTTHRKVRLLVRSPQKANVSADESGDGSEEGEEEAEEQEEDEDEEGEGEEEEQEEEEPTHMFEGILTPEQRSVTYTSILDSDKTLYNKARVKAESKLGPPIAPPLPSGLLTPGPPTPSTSFSAPAPSSLSNVSLLHSLRTRQAALHAQQLNATLESYVPLAPSSHNSPHPPRIRTIRFGEFDIDTWYDAPFPEEYASVHDGKLWICEFCLKYMKSRYQSTRHRMKCKARHPPGDEIYRDGQISIFEVDGRKNKIYCQNLCLLSKMFLDHKSLFYDVEPFLFYVITEIDQLGARFFGYFSKEKRSPKDYNVSCIMTLPIRQRKGWGSALIDFSYCLSKKEGRFGTPERPLSALGALTYKRYWAHAVRLFLHTATEPVVMEDICRATSMTMEDVYNTLQDLKYITVQEQAPARPPPGTPIKYLRGRKHSSGITRRTLPQPKKDENKDQFVIPTDYKISWNPEEIEAYVTEWKGKDQVKINPRLLKWSPFIVAQVPKTATSVEDPDGTTNGHAPSRLPSKAKSSSASMASVRASAASEIHSNGTSERGAPEKGSMMDTHSASAMEVVDEDLLTNVSETSRKSRSSSSWSKSQHSHSAERKRSGSIVPESSRLRTLRPRPSAQQTPRRHAKPEAEGNDSSLSEKESEDEDEGGHGDDDDDGDGDANGQNQFRRLTRSSGRFESPKTKTTHSIATTAGHKRRRIESPSSTDAEDADGSSIGLTHHSVSPQLPSPPLPPLPPTPPIPSTPRRTTRSEKAKPTKQVVNNNEVSKKTDVVVVVGGGGGNGGRVTRSHPQAGQEVLASSPHVNGVSVRKEFERLSVRHTRQAVHTHSETNAECISVNGATPEIIPVSVSVPETVEVDVNMTDIISEKTDSLVMQVAANNNHSTTVIIPNGRIKMFNEEDDELGDEDAEGEEDLDLSDEY